MADVQVQAVEPDPSATSLPNDSQTITEKTVEIAKEPTIDSAEEVTKVQEAKESKDAGGENVIDANNAREQQSDEVESKNQKREAEDHGKTNRDNNRGKSHDQKFQDRKRINNGKFKRQNQSKFDPSNLPETDDPDEIRKQVEFYFSDSNLPLDRFLFDQVGGTENKPFPIQQLCTFKRMRRFQPLSAVIQALKESDFLEVTENDEVKRKVPLDSSLGNQDDNLKIIEDQAMPRTIYAKGFGTESADTQFAIEAFFAPYGPTRAIRLRRHADRTFKGSVFVEFETEDAAKQFLELEPKPKFQQTALDIKSKKAYCEQKVADIKSGKIKPKDAKNYRDFSQRNGRSRGDRYQNRNGRDNKRNDNRRSDQKRDTRGHDYRKGEDDRDWRTRRDEDNEKEHKKEEEGKVQEKVQGSQSPSSKKRGRDEEDVADDAVSKKTKVEQDKVEETVDPGNAAVKDDDKVVNDNVAESAASNPASSTSKKRSRDEEGGGEGQEDTESKKLKAGDETVA